MGKSKNIDQVKSSKTEEKKALDDQSEKATLNAALSILSVKEQIIEYKSMLDEVTCPPIISPN